MSEDKLAMFGGRPAVTVPLQPRIAITERTRKYVQDFMGLVISGQAQLSGYLAGSLYGGQAVQRFEEMWREKFGVEFAIACNSATSGLLAACVAVGVTKGTHVGVPVLSMSATAAVPKWLGARVHYLDVDRQYCAHPQDMVMFNKLFPHKIPTVCIVTNLFGHPAQLHKWMKFHGDKMAIIEDNAQGILATEHGVYTGTIGNIGVTSFNVHKQINAGEMGVITTNDLVVATKMRQFINHGEMAGGPPGLNLRPTELSAIIAIEQLERIDDTVENLRIVAYQINKGLRQPFIEANMRDDCESARYCLPINFTLNNATALASDALRAEGVPNTCGYPPGLLCGLMEGYDTTKRHATANRLLDSLILLELCAWRYEDRIEEVVSAFQKVAKYFRESPEAANVRA